ncbi:LysM peptidoglycan-binding domain-containing protein [Streptomyces sp. A7024]|uniref:LysM peptidoglycan-binding domain-containing protein n=1 Tax=Streptomyces coryli TaxID=1128680 RepID=A0A6G4TXJ5_9ACTN|nr:LysM peptidoglycan-binding domain-containing protein [Streptomyces coryli]NGN64729.1 LysM peptidoglycan-binding domain-containing protein [Streptomyces coryli]
MAGTGTRRAPKQHIAARRVVTVAGIGIALPALGTLAASAANAYTVEKGDTLSDIAADHGYGSDWQKLYEANKKTVGDDPDLILPGQNLDIEGQAKSGAGSGGTADQTADKAADSDQRYVTHTVAAGDSLGKIAEKYDVPGGWQRVYADNKDTIGSDPAALKVGTKLKIDTEGGKVANPVQQASDSSGSDSGSGGSGSGSGSIPTTEAGIKAAAQKMMPADQFTCFSNIVERESSWNYKATNPTSGAYGLVQALPGSKMASAGDDWRTNPITQIKWGLTYMNERYDSPCGAWEFWQANQWY